MASDRGRAAFDRCPCGLGSSFDRCCARLHRGESEAMTAEQLMRSRYSAHVVHDEAYLLHSWHPSSRPERISFDPALRWVQLEITATSGGAMLDRDGTVTFAAHHVVGGRAGVLHEHSAFTRHDQRWVYLGPV